MAKNEEKGEIVLYQPEGEVRLEVRVENETVWLNRQQMALLFNRDIKTIGKHITNALKEELKDLATVANFATVQKEGVRSVSRMIEHYNLDMILSIGYRVKSANGIKFRRWASQVLKDYMLKGYAVNQRKIATDLQIVDRLHEQRQLIESQGTEIADVRKSGGCLFSAYHSRVQGGCGFAQKAVFRPGFKDNAHDSRPLLARRRQGVSLRGLVQGYG